jgi:hypothetical protein
MTTVVKYPSQRPATPLLPTLPVHGVLRQRSSVHIRLARPALSPAQPWEQAGLRNHLTGDGPNSLRTLDPGGSLSKWAAHVVKTATTGAGTLRPVAGGQVLEITAPMALEAGGTTPVGVRLFQATGEETWRLTTILTHP